MERLRRFVPGLWAGVLWCVALLATPAPFATLDKALAGRVVSHVFVREAALSLVLAMLIVLLERRQAAARAELGQGSGFSTGMLMALGAVFCTVAGYYGLQPWMADAKADLPTPLSFGQLHAVSFSLFGIKLLLVSSLAWQATRTRAP